MQPFIWVKPFKRPLEKAYKKSQRLGKDHASRVCCRSRDPHKRLLCFTQCVLNSAGSLFQNPTIKKTNKQKTKKAPTLSVLLCCYDDNFVVLRKKKCIFQSVIDEIFSVQMGIPRSFHSCLNASWRYSIKQGVHPPQHSADGPIHMSELLREYRHIF